MDVGDDNQDALTWRAHPARSRPGAAAFAIIVILAIAAAVAVSFGPIWAAGSALIVALSLNRFFFPSRFDVDRDGIEARYPMRRQRLRWREVRRFVADRNGGYLSTRARSSRLDAFAGMHVLFDADREAAVALIQSRITQSKLDSAATAADVHEPAAARSREGGQSCSA